MTKVFTGDNPTQMYMDALKAILEEGDLVSPRGKDIKELRPVVFEFTNPHNRVTFLKGRIINPFFQLAEALWIIQGRSDVEWLTKYNKQIGQFSDDGKTFNAAYGERLRHWNYHAMTNFVFNPMDQLVDVYRKLIADGHTRQAVALIYNPLFDNASRVTKDTPCNIVLTFKIRKGKLNLTVFNRSNDLHWGLFGANLCQFSTIQEMVACWLDVPVGTYTHMTDSLHIYLEAYGADESGKILGAYLKGGTNNVGIPEMSDFVKEPRMSSDFVQMEQVLLRYNHHLDPIMQDDESIKDISVWGRLLKSIDTYPDTYFKLTFNAMAAYRAYKLNEIDKCIEALSVIPMCQWKVSCLRFLSKSLNYRSEFVDLYRNLPQATVDYINREDIK